AGMTIRTHQLSHSIAQDACLRGPVAFASGKQRLWRHVALLATSALAFVALATVAHAQDATWLPNPATHDFNTGSNWSGGAVPNGTATFNASSQRDIRFSQNAFLGGISLTAGAGAYTFTNDLFNQTISLNGIGLKAADGASLTFTNGAHSSALQFF